MDATRLASTLEGPVYDLKTGQLQSRHRVLFNHKGTTPMNTPIPAKPERYLRLPEVESLTGLRKSSIYAGMKASPPTFPYCIRLSTRAVAWRESDIATWQAQRQPNGGRP